MKEALKWLKCTKKTGRLRMIAMDWSFLFLTVQLEALFTNLL